MQRRAVAIYVAFFLIVGAAAYGLIQTTSAPTVSMDGPTYAEGDEVTIGDRTYTVTSAGADSAELSWVNDSGVVTTSLDNGSEVPVTDVVWDDQLARQQATFGDDETVTEGDAEYAVAVNASAGTLALTNVDDDSDNRTVGQDEGFLFRGFQAVVTDVSSDGATVVWGGPYLLTVDAENVTDPTEATFVEQRNVSRLAAADPALYAGTVQQDDRRKVTYRANDTNVPVQAYFRAVERHRVAEGDTLQYQGNEMTVDEVDNESVTLRRPTETTTTVTLGAGENVTIRGEEFFAHVPANGTVQILPTAGDYGTYHAQNRRLDSYHQRIVAFWGIAILSAFAVIVLIASAILPVKG
jgi:hypothetical protein